MSKYTEDFRGRLHKYLEDLVNTNLNGRYAYLQTELEHIKQIMSNMIFDLEIKHKQEQAEEEQK